MPRSQFARPLLGEPLRRATDLEQEAPELQPEHEPDHAAGPGLAPVRRSLEVGAADDRAEHEADAVADRVMERLAVPHQHGAGCGHDDAAGESPVRRAPAPAAPAGAATIGAAGGALDADATTAIESARGGGTALPAGVRREMESGFGQSLADVRIHTDARAAGLSRGMSARAFTTGSDIFFDQGQFAPHTDEGKRVLAHEIAHTRQDSGVRRKMRGTAEALRSQGDEKGDKGKSSGFLRKLVGKLTNWDKLVAAVQAYEAEEAKLLAGGQNPSPIVLAKAKPGMLKLLTKVQTLIAEWRSANDEESETGNARATAKKKKEEEGTGTDADGRRKAARRQAVSMLEPRVGHEVSLLSAKDGAGWISSLGLSTGQVSKVGASKSGQMNTTSQIDYKTEAGDFSGYFKEDKGFNKQILSQETEVGIEQFDPNYGARSVALYRLDQLFNANVTARAEFAIGKNKDGKSVLGTVLEGAKGTEASEMKYRTDADGPMAGRASLDDPALQRGLNKLQILDAISGQLDRHMGNYYIQTDDQGAVTGVTGIDLDMAFGKDMQTTADPGAMNYKGLPEFIDQEMGDKILAVKDSDIRDALTGLLPEPEIKATLSRFAEVQQAVRDAAKNGKLRPNWNATTAVEGTSWKDSTYEAKTYHQQAKDLRREDIDKLADSETADLARELLHRGQWSEMPDSFYSAASGALQFGNFFKGRAGGMLAVAVATYAFENHLPLRVIPPVAKIVTQAFFETVDVNRLAVDLQEWDPTKMWGFENHLKEAFAKTLKDLMPKLQRRLNAASR